MFVPTTQYLPYVTPVFFVLVMVCLNHTVRDRLLHWRSSKQANRIAIVLYIELAVLRDLYQRNLELIMAGSQRLLCGRPAPAGRTCAR